MSANEKDAMALAVLDNCCCILPMFAALDGLNYSRADLIEARAHLANRIAEDADEIFRLNTRLIEETNRTDRAEAELAAVRAWLAKLESFVGPGALAYMRRESDAARGGE